MEAIKVMVERHDDGYVAYPLGVVGVCVGQGDTFEEALRDVRSAITFHVETFGAGAFLSETPVREAYVADAAIAVP